MNKAILLTALCFALGVYLSNAQQTAETAAPPPSAPAQRSAAELEKLVAPIALYADPLLATVLPASVYPLEIVQAARFVADTNNLARLEEQPWDDNVKAVARVPDLIKKMNDELSWTIGLGEAFLAQEKDLLEAIQRLRAKAQAAGTLRTTQQQAVVVTNVISEKTVEERVTVVTNTVVQIQPADPEVIYVPTYDPAYVYNPPPTYVYDPYAPLVAFGAGIAVGAIIWNDCDWDHGGIYVGPHGAVIWGGDGHHPPPPPPPPPPTGNRPPPGDRPPPSGDRPARPDAPQKWQPDANRLRASGTLGSAGTARTLEARGWTSGGARPSALPSTGNVSSRPSTGNLGARPSTGNVATRPASAPSVSRPSASPSFTPSARPATTSSGGSAFGGISSGSSTRSFSDRGFSSRSGSGFGGGANISRGGGGMSRGGGRGGRR